MSKEFRVTTVWNHELAEICRLDDIATKAANIKREQLLEIEYQRQCQADEEREIEYQRQINEEREQKQKEKHSRKINEERLIEARKERAKYNSKKASLIKRLPKQYQVEFDTILSKARQFTIDWFKELVKELPSKSTASIYLDDVKFDDSETFVLICEAKKCELIVKFYNADKCGEYYDDIHNQMRRKLSNAEYERDQRIRRLRIMSANGMHTCDQVIYIYTMITSKLKTIRKNELQN